MNGKQRFDRSVGMSMCHVLSSVPRPRQVGSCAPAKNLACDKSPHAEQVYAVYARHIRRNAISESELTSVLRQSRSLSMPWRPEEPGHGNEQMRLSTA